MKKLLKYLSLTMMVCLLMVPGLRSRAAGAAAINEVTANSITISWNGTAAAYNIGWNTNADTAKNSPNVTNFAGNTYKIDNLASGTKYYIVVADASNGNVVASNVVATNLGVPTNVRQKSWSQQDNKVVVAWDFDGQASGFQVVYTDDDGDSYSKDNIDPGTKEITLNMKDVRYYKVIVRAFVVLDNNAKKYGDFSETFTTFAQPVIKETDDGFSVSVKNGKMTVTWERVREAHGYEIYVSRKKNSGYKRCRKITGNTTTKATFKFNGKKFNKKSEYYVYVVGYRNSNGKIERSSSNYVVYYRKGDTFIAKKKGN